jgi:sporulation and spore germination protein
MTPRWRTRLLVGLALAVVAAAIYFPILRRRVQRAARLQQQSEEQARRELTLTLPANPGQPRVRTKLFWASSTEDGVLVPTTVDLPLSDDPVLRAKQVLNTLLAGPVDTELRTLPPDAALLEFYLLPDGTAIADFSEALATSTPSGIQSEQLAVDSIARTLEADVPQVQRMRILIHGQEMETLAGHLDLTGTFVVNTKPAPTLISQPSATSAPAADKASVEPGKLTPGSAPGKLAQPGHKP